MGPTTNREQTSHRCKALFDAAEFLLAKQYPTGEANHQRDLIAQQLMREAQRTEERFSRRHKHDRGRH
jgi:hypothetical protein